MEGSPIPSRAPGLKRMAVYVAAVAIGGAGAGAGYGIHEHRTARTLVTQNEQVTAALDAMRNQLDDLAEAAPGSSQAPNSNPQPSSREVCTALVGAVSPRRIDTRWIP